MSNIINTTIKKIIQSKKSIEQSKNNVYTFKVNRLSNKFHIKLAFEKSFSVKVEKVRTSFKKNLSLNKKKSPNRFEKKAFVKIKEGYKINEIRKFKEIVGENGNLNSQKVSTEEVDVSEETVGN